ncbi:MAG: methylmalonyl Co-A mutase-associated GTPase MeaB, partial [Anaerolineales bacterium]
MSLVERVLNDDRLALARLLTLIENGEPAGDEALAELYPHTGSAHLVGLTGGTGTGKSTLANQITRHLRTTGLPQADGSSTPIRVAIVAVDPTSPFTGGAILGDRIRMRDLAGDSDVFIRSMATRGALGGLAGRTRPVIHALDAAGYDLILIETVGAGQSEVEVARTAHTTIVVDAPGLGDDVQAIKAGILEIADILVVNKADLPGSDRAAAALKAALRFAPDMTDDPSGSERWQVPVLTTVAVDGSGVADVVDAIAAHKSFMRKSGRWQRREREGIEAEIGALVRQQLSERFLGAQPNGRYEELIQQVQDRKLSPRQAVQTL